MNSASSEPGWEQEIAIAEHEANDAFLNRDLGRLDALFSDALVVNSPINVVNDKKTILHLLGTGIIGHVASKIQHELIRRDGELVVVMGSDAVKNSHDEPTVQRRFTNIWRMEGNRWRLYVRHANVIAAQTQTRPRPSHG